MLREAAQLTIGSLVLNVREKGEAMSTQAVGADILQGIAAVRFDEAWKDRVETFLDRDTPAHVISLEHLIKNKLASGRHQDIADAEKLREVAALKKQARKTRARFKAKRKIR